jgi:hypothetical protein
MESNQLSPNVSVTNRIIRSSISKTGRSDPSNSKYDEVVKTFVKFPVDDEQILVPVELSGKVLTQAWYRLLHCIGNPVQLARPSIISQTHKFLQYTIISSQVLSSRHLLTV